LEHVEMPMRAKALLVILLLTLTYGVYEFIFSTPSGTTVIDAEAELRAMYTLVKEIAADVNKENISAADTYIIARAETEWRKDLFWARHETDAPELDTIGEGMEAADLIPEETREPQITFTYSGYLELGSKRIAIIDGMEYEIGEELESGGYTVRSIFPNRVLIEVKGERQVIIVPIAPLSEKLMRSINSDS
jgi:hypothetical protein